MDDIEYNTELMKQELISKQISNEELKAKVLRAMRVYWDRKIDNLRRK